MTTTQAAVENTDIVIWSRLLRPDNPTLSPQAARAILALEFTQEDKNRMHQLAAKAREGTLTAEEQAETRSYERVGNLLSLMKSKARLALKKASKSA